jgi:predicted nucleic acid-binding protein
MANDILDADWETTRQATLFKTLGNIPYTDCFAAALAKRLHAKIVTGDKEFAALEGQIGIA